MMFDVIADNIGVIFVLLVIMWGLQFGMTYIQMRKYTKRLKIIRQDGLTAVGMGGSRYKGRAYGILTIDDDNKIIHAEKMSGWTNFAGLKPVPTLVGMNVEEIISEGAELPVSKKLKVAFQNAANDLLQARKDGIEFEAPSNFIDKKKAQGQ
jgi:DNA-binding transcriptional regulator of glucitol operon